MSKEVDYKEALELVKLRMKEDHIGLGTATREYAGLTDMSFTTALREVGNTLRDYKQSMKE